MPAAQLLRQVPGQQSDDVAVRQLQVAQPGVLLHAERIRRGGLEFRRIHRTGALRVGQHQRRRLQPQHARAVPGVQQAGVRLLLGDREHLGAGRRAVEQPHPTGQPQQPAHGLAQPDRRRVRELQHGGEFGARSLPGGGDQRVFIGEQQGGGAIGVHVVQQRRDARRSLAGRQERRAATALGDAPGSFRGARRRGPAGGRLAHCSPPT